MLKYLVVKWFYGFEYWLKRWKDGVIKPTMFLRASYRDIRVDHRNRIPYNRTIRKVKDCWRDYITHYVPLNKFMYWRGLDYAKVNSEMQSYAPSDANRIIETLRKPKPLGEQNAWSHACRICGSEDCSNHKPDCVMACFAEKG